MASKTEAYIAQVSLMNTLMQILYPPRSWISLHDHKQMQRLLDDVHSLVDFLEDEGNAENIDGLESQMASSAYAAEDVVESYVLDLNLARSTGTCSVEKTSSTCFTLHVQNLIEEMDLIISKVTKIKETAVKSLKGPMAAVLSRLAPNRQTIRGLKGPVVGIDDKVIVIMDILDEQQSDLQILAIVGMGGIGKSTLARHVFDNPYIVYKFDIRAWVTISQEYSVRKIILELLSELKDIAYQGQQRGDNLAAFSDDELGECLYKSLYGRTYLIVMDDMWCSEAWDEIHAFFPDNCNGSRILITTRLSSVAGCLSSQIPFQMEFLDDGQSWKLLCETVFGKDEGCPPELSNLGQMIAAICRGLPLSIAVIGGLLAKSNMTVEFWDYVATNLNSIVNLTDDENCLKILSLSYKNLPIYLKPCFLHMSFFQNQSVEENWLIKLWVTEGVIKPKRDKPLEGVGHEYLMDLISRNLIVVTSHGTLDEQKVCSIHDLLLYLCLEEAQKENFHYALDIDSPAAGIQCKRRLYFKKESSELGHDQVDDALTRASQLRSIYFRDFGTTSSLGPNLRLLRLLHQDHGGISSEIMKLVNLRLMYYGFLIPNSGNSFTSSLSQFWNLQTLVLRNAEREPILLPSDIWEMPQIRHIECRPAHLPDPPPRSSDQHEDFYILENLQTLLNVIDFSLTEEVLERIPNVKILWVQFKFFSPGLEYLHNLFHFDKLEELYLDVRNRISMENLRFPISLKELCLVGCQLDWNDMTIVGSLPNLGRLMLWARAFDGLSWCPIEGEFVRLKLLRVNESRLIEWRVDKTHFPILEYLIIGKMDNLEEIPMEIGEIPTLRSIRLENCNDSIIISAKRILKEQESYGYGGSLQVIVECREPRLDLTNLESENFRVVIKQ